LTSGAAHCPRSRPKAQRHGNVSGIHNTAPLPPSARPSGLRQLHPALARSFRFRIPQPPAPRGRQDRACSQVVIPTLGQRELVLFLFWGFLLKVPPPGAARSRRRLPAPSNTGIQFSGTKAAPSIGPG